MKFIILMVMFCQASSWAQATDDVKKSAELSDFPFLITPEKKIYKAGEKVSVSIKCPASAGKIVFSRGQMLNDIINEVSDCAGKTDWSFEIPRKTVGLFSMVASLHIKGSKPLLSSLKIEVAANASAVSLHLIEPKDDTFDSKSDDSIRYAGTSKGCHGAFFNVTDSSFRVFAKFSDGNSAAICGNPKAKISIIKDQKQINVEATGGEWCTFKLAPSDVGNLTIKVSYENLSKEWICHITSEKELH